MSIASTLTVRFLHALREVHFFDRTRRGRLSKAAFWYAVTAHLAFLSLLFLIPFETAYRLEMAPDSAFVLVWMNVFNLAFLASLMPLKRLAVRRLNDAGYSGWWLWVAAVPCAGWCAVIVLLCLPSTAFPNRFDRFAEPQERKRG